MAGGEGRRSRVLARDAPGSGNGRAPHQPARRARVLELLPLRRRLDQRGRRPASRDAGAGIDRHQAADAHQVPAGGALAVDRDGFSRPSKRRFCPPLVTLERGEIAGLPPEDWDNVIVATGPLTSPALAEAIGALTGEGALAFFDAIAPIVHRDSIDMDVAWMQSRYDKEGPAGDAAAYVNCPMSRDAVRGLHRRAARGGEDRVPRIRGHALFRRLPADRGDGRARPRDPAPRADEAGRPHQRA